MTRLASDPALPDCDVCTSVAAYRTSYGDVELDIRVVEERLAKRFDDGRMHVLKSDVPLRDMVSLAESDLKYTIALFARCDACGTTWFYGLCIRGQPLYKPVEAGAEERWLWSPVPERALWAR